MFASAYYASCLTRGPAGYNSGNIQQVDSPKQLKGKKLLFLWGGEDISPSLYGQAPVRARAGEKPSRRDEIEVNLAKAAIQEGIPILGICRGAQLMCALGGGSLYQHVDNHGVNHWLNYKDHKVMSNSCHHQMMIPTEDMQVLATTECRSPKKWQDQEDCVIVNEPEPEIVYMPKHKALGVQGHPEWMDYDSEFVKLVRQLTGELLHVEI